jgi:hypothetical protein
MNVIDREGPRVLGGLSHAFCPSGSSAVAVVRRNVVTTRASSGESASAGATIRAERRTGT